MIDAIIFPIPALFSQLSLSALSPDRAIWLATIGFVGRLIGTPIGYGIGKVSGNLVLTKIMKKNGTIRPPHCSPSTGSRYSCWCVYSDSVQNLHHPLRLYELSFMETTQLRPSGVP